MAQYFRGASRQHLQIQWTVDGTLYSLPKKMIYYGSDAHEEERVVETRRDGHPDGERER